MHRSAVDLAQAEDDRLYFGTPRRDEDVSGHLGPFFSTTPPVTTPSRRPFTWDFRNKHNTMKPEPWHPAFGFLLRRVARFTGSPASREPIKRPNWGIEPDRLSLVSRREPKNLANKLPPLDVAAAAIGTRRDWLDGGTSGDRRWAGRLAAACCLAEACRGPWHAWEAAEKLAIPESTFRCPGSGVWYWPILAEGLRGRAVVAGGVGGTGWSVAPGRFDESLEFFERRSFF